MRSGIVGLLLLLASSTSALAQTYNPDGSENVRVLGGSGSSTNLPTIPGQFTALGCQQITSLGTAVGFASVPTGATLAFIAIEGQPVRYRDDGTNPTASIGTPLLIGGPNPYTGPLSTVRFIQTAASAIIDVCFYK